MISTGMASLSLLEDHFIRFFALCGSLQEADQVFSRAQNPNVYAWHAIISAHVTHGDSHMALRLYGHMRFGGIEPDKVVFLSILKACGNIGGIDQGRLTHDHVITRGLDVNVAVGSCLIDMYAKCGSLDEAQRVFDRLPIRDVVLWGSLISAYVHHGQGLPALKLFVKIHLDSIEPDKFIFSSILKACGSVEVLDEGKLIHDHITRSGLESDVIVGSALIDMYAKCNSMQDASTVFDRLSDKNVVSWNALIAGHVQHGHGLPALQLYDKMKGNGTNANKVTFLCVLKACGCVMALEKGRAIHNQLIKNGFESHVPIQSALIDMYAKCGSLQEMSRVFDGMANGDLVSWNATIAGYVQHGYDVAALYLFQKMEENGIKKDGFTLSCALKACSSVGAVEEGRIIHNQIISGGLKSDVVMESSLVVMYAKCGSLQEAHRMFGKMVTPDVVSWNGMISGYVFHGQSAQALQLVEKMQTKGLKPSLITFASILKACKSMESAVHGRLIHDQIVRSGFESEVVPASTLVDMYTNFGNLEEAFNLFDRLQTPNLVTWNVMIAGCAQYGDGPAALQLFGRMQLEGTKPDNVTFLCILQACGSIGSLAQGRLAHDQILRIGLELDPSVGTALVNMYARCGSLDEGHGMLDALPSRNVVSWGALIAGYAQHGNYKLVIQCFMIMQEEGLKPDGTIYSSVLAACSHSGQVDEGHWHFNCMRDDYGITPSIEHFNCMVDLLGRAGCLYEAKKLLQTMPILADVSGWISLLTACKTYRNVELGRYCFNQIVQKDSNAAAAYLLISSIYADAHMWEDVYRISELRRFEGAFKKPGRAWIEISKEMHEFIAGNKVHAESDEIYSKSKTLIKILNCEGYVPHLSLVLEQSAKDRSEEEQCVSDCHSKLLYLSL